MAFAVSPTTSESDTTFSRQFGLVSGGAPGLEFSFQTSLADDSAVGSATGTWSTLGSNAVRIECVLKTPVVYWDTRTLEVIAFVANLAFVFIGSQYRFTFSSPPFHFLLILADSVSTF
jgi:hypothetical protein